MDKEAVSLVVADESSQAQGADCTYTEHGSEYMGHTAVTASGLTCQRWLTFWPHKHTYDQKVHLFPDDNVEDASNYCRNPGGHGTQPWCYTLNPEKRWIL